jgi:arginase
MRRVAVIGVPSSAGAHGPGQEKAPSALRQAGLLGALREAGLEVEDLGDLPVTRFQPDHGHTKQQSLPRVVAVDHQVADAVDAAVARGTLPLVLGGDCTITIGVIAGLLRRQLDLGLIYCDGDADLTTPTTTHSGIFDSMGMAHLIGDGVAELARIGPRYPLLPQDRIALFGFHPFEVEPTEQRRLDVSGMLRYPVTSMGDRPVAFAADARAKLEARAAAIVVHFDVDVMDSAEIPLADWPHYDALEFGETMRCLSVFVSSPKLAALVVTEINPDHDPDGLLIRRFIEGFVEALQPIAAQAAGDQQRHPY